MTTAEPSKVVTPGPCPTDGVCPPCTEGFGHWTGGRYVPTIESTAAAFRWRVVATRCGYRSKWGTGAWCIHADRHEGDHEFRMGELLA